jgi:hypothetical protein
MATLTQSQGAEFYNHMPDFNFEGVCCWWTQWQRRNGELVAPEWAESVLFQGHLQTTSRTTIR